jgi:hypothetical protein
MISAKAPTIPAILILITLQAAAQEKHRITGQVVGTDAKPLSGIPILVSQGADTNNGTTDKNGSYSITFPSGRTIDSIVYGDNAYLPASDINLSGSSDHRITKVLSRNDPQAKLSSLGALEVTGTLNLFRSNPTLYAEQMIQWAGTIRSDQLPEDLRPSLEQYESAVATFLVGIEKRNTQSGTRLVVTTASMPTGNISLFYVPKEGEKVYNDRFSASIRDAFPDTVIGQPVTVQANRIITNVPLIIGDQRLAAGSYDLKLKNRVTFVSGKPLWTMIFHNDKTEAELPLSVSKVANSVQRLTISLFPEKHRTLVIIHLGDTILSGTVEIG